ncbi:MAG: tRNA threonylcarbamoyladenosine dehydratase [Clostridia bacterium]|nr:tRNA threonylcarbamoyladenosine dehydratase [Clostridia bacterium]
MENQFSRTELLIGKEGIEKLKNAKVAVFGIGGVGSYTVEALARAGVGHLIIVDFDKYDITNINRQLGATHSTIGKYKTDIMKERILDINPNAIVETYKPDEIEGGETILIDPSITYAVDAIDTMTNKIRLIEKCKELNVNIITVTGAGNKLDGTKFEVSDIYKTSVCPVCKILRKELKNRNINNLKVVYSKEVSKKPNNEGRTLGSISYVPSIAGLIAAGEVIKDIIKDEVKNG